MTSERSRDAAGKLTGTSASSDGLLRTGRPLTWNLRKCPLSKQFTLESGMTTRRPDRTQVERRRMAGRREPYTSRAILHNNCLFSKVDSPKAEPGSVIGVLSGHRSGLGENQGKYFFVSKYKATQWRWTCSVLCDAVNDLWDLVALGCCSLGRLVQVASSGKCQLMLV